MTWRIEQIVTLVGGRTPDLEAWIAEQWIRPIRDEIMRQLGLGEIS